MAVAAPAQPLQQRVWMQPTTVAPRHCTQQLSGGVVALLTTLVQAVADVEVRTGSTEGSPTAVAAAAGGAAGAGAAGGMPAGLQGGWLFS